MTNRLWWLFPLSGGFYGAALWYLLTYVDERSLYLAPLMIFIIAAAYCCWFAIGVRKLWRDIVFSLVVCGLTAGQVAVFQALVGFANVYDTSVTGLFVAQAVWVGVLVAMWRSPASAVPNDDGGNAEDAYNRGTMAPPRGKWGRFVDIFQIVPQIWNIKLSLAFGGVAIGVFWIMAYLLATLLNIVGFTALKDFLESSFGGALLSGAAFATGIMLTREKPNLLKAVRQVLGTLYRFFYPLQAAGVFLFLLLGALGGWEQLLGQDTSMCLVVTAAALWLSYLLFGAIQSGVTTTLFGRRGDVVFRYTLWMAPLCALAAIGTIWIRVDDYGLTPQRIYSTWIAVVVLIGTLWIMRAGMMRAKTDGKGMIAALQRAFGQVAFGGAMIAFLIHLPWLDPVSIAAGNQQTRMMQSDTLKHTDLAFMAQALGKPGEKAVAALKQAHPDAVPDLAELRSMPVWRNQRQEVAASEIPVFPENQPYSRADLTQMMDKDLQFDRQFCKSDTVAMSAPQAENKCALLIVDLDGDGIGEAVFFSLRPVATVLKYRPQKKQWASVRTLFLEKGNGKTDIIAQLKQGDFKLKTPAYSDLSVGGVLWEQTR